MKAWLASLSDTQRGWLAAAIVPFSPVLIPLFIAGLFVGGVVMLIWGGVLDGINDLAGDKPRAPRPHTKGRSL